MSEEDRERLLMIADAFERAERQTHGCLHCESRKVVLVSVELAEQLAKELREIAYR